MTLTEEGMMFVPGVSSQWIKLASGARAHYMVAGESGPAIVLLHGGLAGSSGIVGWRFMMPVLAKAGFRVYAPDRPGFGDADPREEYWPRHGWKSHVEFVKEFVDALCLDKFHIGGNSQGMQNAVHFMVNHPDRIISAALIATAGLPVMAGVDATKLTQQNPRFVYPPFDGTKESMGVLMESIIFKKDAIDDDLLTMRTRCANIQKESFTAFQGGIRSEDPNLVQGTDLSNRLKRLTFPMILLQGRQDVTLLLENIEKTEPYLPNIQFFYPDKCGHQGQTDQPEMFNQVFTEFFRDGKVARKTADWAGVSKNRPEIASLVEH